MRADSPRSGRISASTGAMFARRIRAMDIRDRPTSPRSPWLNPYVDRKAPDATILDLVLMFGARHLRRIQTSYSCYYNEYARIHRWARIVRRSSGPATWDHCSYTYFVQATLLLHADMIFGKDRHVFSA